MSGDRNWKTWPLVRNALAAVEALAGPRPARRRASAAMATPRDFRSRLPSLERCGGEIRKSTEEPVFVMSAGWRSGSTMLQRMLMGSGDVLIWGEPYDHSDVVGSLKGQLLAFTDEWPASTFFFDGNVDGAAQRWVANLYPALQDLYDAHAAYLERLFAEPARRAGCRRWGVKEVRWSVDDALYLRWVFPQARFLFLSRDPEQAWRSYRASRGWFLRWPDSPVLTPGAFGRLWARLAADFLDHHADVDGRLLRYEELRELDDLGDLEAYLGFAPATAAEIGRVRSRTPREEPAAVPALERLLLRRGCGAVAARMGYRP